MRSLLSIDPGSSRKGIRSDTGVVRMAVPVRKPAYLLDSWTVQNGIDGFREHMYGVLDMSDIIIVEKFVDRQIPGADRSPLLIEGAVRFMRGDAVLSPASGYKTVVPDEILERFEMNFKGDHHADRKAAARHALRWLLKNHSPTAKFGWGHLK